MSMWYERLKKLREQKNLTQTELGEKIGKDLTAISRYEKGGGAQNLTYKLKQSLRWVFTPDEIDYIENGARANISQTATGNGINQVHGNGNTFNHLEKVETIADQSNERMVNIPFLHNVYASAGGGAVVPTEGDPAIMSFSESFLRDFFRLDTFKGMHIITATGNSMEPKIYAGELLFINPYENENSSIVEGAIYVVLSSGHIYVKRIYPNGRELKLVSDNDKVSDIILMGDEIDEMKIIGRVVGHFDKL